MCLFIDLILNNHVVVRGNDDLTMILMMMMMTMMTMMMMMTIMSLAISDILNLTNIYLFSKIRE